MSLKSRARHFPLANTICELTEFYLTENCFSLQLIASACRRAMSKGIEMTRITTAAAAVARTLTIGTAAPAGAQGRDIVDTAVAAGSFTTLAKALQAADLVNTLKGAGPFTDAGN